MKSFCFSDEEIENVNKVAQASFDEKQQNWTQTLSNLCKIVNWT